MTVVKGFTSKWNLIPEKEINKLGEDATKKRMRKWQKDCFSQLITSGKNNYIINSPTGSGKSTQVSYLANAVAKVRKNIKVIIAVPQTGISDGFTKPCTLIYPEPTNDIDVWQVNENLCDSNNDDKINKLTSFILNDPIDIIHDRIAVCTHQTLSYTFNKLREEDKLDDIKNLVIWIDEAHHIAVDDDNSNRLGEVVDYFLNNQERDLYVNLVTATLFRGDRIPVVSSDKEHMFARFNLPYDEHFEECDYLKEFKYDFIIPKEETWLDSISLLYKEGYLNKGYKDIIYIPHPNSVHHTGCKYTEVQQIIDVIGGVDHVELEVDNPAVTCIKRSNGEVINIVDLVDEDVQIQGKKFIANNPDQVDVIINLNMFTEGADWPQANRGIIVGNKNSLTQLMQMIGRLFRDHKSKKERAMEIYHILPNINNNLEEEDLKEQLNDNMKAVWASLILEQVLNPIKISLNKNEDNGEREKKVGLTDLIHDANIISKITKEITDNFANFIALNEDIPQDKLPEERKRIIMKVLDDYELDEKETICDLLIKQATKRTNEVKARMAGIDVSDIDFDIVFGYQQYYASQMCGVNSLREYRDIIKNLDAQWQNTYNLVKNFIEEYKKYPRCNSTIESELSLANWIQVQRQFYKKQNLSENRISALKKIPHWVWDVDKERWNIFYTEVLNFYEKNGKMPSSSPKAKEYNLGGWCVRQKKLYNEGILPEENIILLKKIPEFFHTTDDFWDSMYNTYIDFYNKNKRKPYRTSKNIEEAKIAKWESHQRTNLKIKKLSQFRIKKLNALSFWTWEKDFSTIWDKNLKEYKEYVIKNNNFPTFEKEKVLYRWGRVQKANYHKNILSKERIKKIEEIPNWIWAEREENWYLNFNILKTYNGTPPPRTSKEKMRASLSNWSHLQRKLYRENKLESKKIQLLESLSNWKWKEREENWYSMANEVKEFFIKNNKKPYIKSKNLTEKKMGRWLSQQRYRTEKLSKDKIDFLNSIYDGKWRSKLSWEEMFEKLQQFCLKEHRLPNYKDGNINTWINNQKRDYRRKILSTEKINKLQTIEYWEWDRADNIQWFKKRNSYALFVQQNKKHPSAGVKEEKKLYYWANNNKNNYKKGSLSQKRIAALESIEGWKWYKDDN